MRFQGKLTNWNDDRGFGFVEPNGGGDRAFVHIKSFRKPSRRPINEDLITYELLPQSGGKYKAINVSLVGDRHSQHKSPKQSRKLGSLITSVFCVALALLTLLKLLPVEVLLLYIVASLIAFVFYAVDKSAAQNNRWRTPENHLHILALIGGWPGALFAQNKLRHKSSKNAFKNVFWVTVVINMSAFFWLFSEKGQQLLYTMVG